METLMNDINLGPSEGESSNRPACEALAPKYTRKGLSIMVEYPNGMEDIPDNGDKKQKLSAKKAFDILKRMTNDDIIALGLDPKYTRPEWLLITVLPVPPPHVRPPVDNGDTDLSQFITRTCHNLTRNCKPGGVFSEDDLTFQLINVIKANLTLEASLGINWV